MIRILLSKVWQILPVIVVVSFASFFLLELVPGDPAVAVLGQNASPEEYERVRDQLGLNVPLFERYGNWVGDVVTGNFGESVFPPNRDVSDLIAQRLPVTIELGLLSMLLSLVIAVPVALMSAYRPGKLTDRVATGLAFGAISIPSFFAGLLFVFFLVFNPTFAKAGIICVGALLVVTTLHRGRQAARLGHGGLTRPAMTAGIISALTALIVAFLPAFPRQGFVRISDGGLRENLLSVALPVFTLTLTQCAIFMRVLRSDMIDTLGEDFILAARAKGMPSSRILVRDALRPSLFSLVTIMSVTIGQLIGGSVVVEMIFNLPGLGRLIIDSITVKDYPVVQACVLMIAIIYVVSSALVDVAYAALDPRIRRGR